MTFLIQLDEFYIYAKVMARLSKTHCIKFTHPVLESAVCECVWRKMEKHEVERWVRGDAKSVLYIIHTFTIFKLLCHLSPLYPFCQMKEHHHRLRVQLNNTIPILGEIYLPCKCYFWLLCFVFYSLFCPPGAHPHAM